MNQSSRVTVVSAEAPQRTGSAEDLSTIAAFLSYLASYRELAWSTIDGYRTDLARIARFMASRGVALAAATVDDVRALVVAETRRGLAAASVNGDISRLRSLFRYLRTVGRASEDPTHGVRLQPEPDRLPFVLTHAEVEALLDIRGDGFPQARDRLLLELLYATGARISEAAAINVQQVGDDGTVTLRGRGGIERAAFLTPSARLALAHYLPLREALLKRFAPNGWTTRKESLHGADSAKALFLDQRARRLSQWGASLLVRQRARATLPEKRVCPRMIRDTFAVDLLNAGAPVIVTKELLGYTKATATKRYQRLAVQPLHDCLVAAHPHGMNNEKPRQEPKKGSADAIA